ncbi:metalloendopeptidase, partial [Trichonephila clavata]
MAPMLGFLLLCVGTSLAIPMYSEEHPPMENPDLYGGDIAGEDLYGDKSAIVGTNRLWPGGVVPYVEDPGLQETVRYMFLIGRAMDHFKRNTCVRFVPRTNEKDYIRLHPGQG